jgi:hypothetical protein
MWSGVIAIPPGICWYLTQFAGAKAWVPMLSWHFANPILSGLFLLLLSVAAIANARVHATLHRVVLQGAATTKESTKEKLLELGTPAGILGSMNDLLAETELKFTQLESSYWQVIEAWNAWIKAAKEAEGRQVREGLSWERAFPERGAKYIEAQIGVVLSVFLRRLSDLHDLLDKRFRHAKGETQDN